MTDGKVALVTGAGQGIGEAISLRLAQDGFSVGVLDINKEQAENVVNKIHEEDGKAKAVVADVSDRDAVFDAVRHIAEHFGRFDVIVNNAGISPFYNVEEITQENFDQMFSINVAGVIWGAQAAIEQFDKYGNGGKIISATSQAGVVGNPGTALYSGTKFAVRGFTQSAARDLGHRNITVNAYGPGVVQTPMFDSSMKQIAEKTGQSEESVKEGFTESIAIGKLSKPENIASTVSFLAGPDSDHITGQTILVDGGMQFL